MNKKKVVRFCSQFLGVAFGSLGVFLFVSAVITPAVNTLGAVSGIILFSLGIALMFVYEP